MEDEFKPGDVVRLRSGGPLMTVETVRERGTVLATWWFNTANEIQCTLLPVTCFVRAQMLMGGR